MHFNKYHEVNFYYFANLLFVLKIRMSVGGWLAFRSGLRLSLLTFLFMKAPGQYLELDYECLLSYPLLIHYLLSFI